MAKYGEDAFDWAVIRQAPDFFSGLAAEREEIARRRGALDLYNLTDGGGGVKGHRHSAVSREKMAAAKRGKPSPWSGGKMPKEIRERLAACRRAERGAIRSEKAKAAMRQNSQTANAARRKSVVCLNDGVVYGSVTEAAVAYGVTHGRVSYLCSGSHRSRSGLDFRYSK
jgi:hypothetical protein